MTTPERGDAPDVVEPPGADPAPHARPPATAPRQAGGALRKDDEPPVANRRFWSVRRAPAALVALPILVAAAALLYDLVAARGDLPPAAWRTGLLQELALRRLDDPWVLTGASVVLLAGLWLLILALTPGLRGLLPMERTSPLTRPGLERGAVSLILRDRAMDVSGVQSVRVSVGRHAVRVTARVHFRQVAVVRAELEAVLGRSLDELGLARRPALSLRARRPGKE